MSTLTLLFIIKTQTLYQFLNYNTTQMAISTSTLLKTALCIFLLSISVNHTGGARILTDTTQLSTNQHDSTGPIDDADTPDVAPQVDPTPDDTPTTITPAPLVSPSIPSPAVTNPFVATSVTTPVATPAGGSAPVATPAPGGGSAPVAKAAGGSATVVGTVPATGAEHPTMSFFMHDVIGGSHATSRVVTGIVASSNANVVPFSTPNSQVFPITGGIPLNNINGIVNNNNLPFLAGFNGNNPNNPNSNTVLQNTGNNNVVNGGNNLPFVAAGQLPAGITLQQLMFGSITVIDNELTEGHELGTGVIGRGQGFYLASSLDGSSHTFALTTLFHGGGGDHEVDDTISFFGVHRTASEISHIAVIGGTGKYEEAKGYATIESLPQVDEQTTDGVESIVHVNIYLTTP